MTNVTITLPNGTSIVWEVSEAEAKKVEGSVQEIAEFVKVEIEGEAK